MGGQARGRGLVSCAGSRTFFDSDHIASFSSLPSAFYSKTSSPRGYLPRRVRDLCSLVPTADAEPEILWNVWLHQKIPSSISIWSGVDIYDGRPVAVKALLNKAETREYIIAQLALASQYRYRPAKGILGIIETWCGHWRSPPCLIRASNDIDHCRHTYFSMPLAEQNFLHDRWRHLKTMESVTYLYHTLCGLAELHNQGFTHGNIRPELLLICEKRAFISLCMNKPERPAASICVAPEFWLSRDRESDLDATKLDIWALAASWLYRCLKAAPDLMVTQRSHASIQETLRRRNEVGDIKGPLYRLFRRMLAWEPHDRPSASEALEDEAWRPILAPKVVERKRKRAQTEQEGQSRRVRLAIPRVAD